MSSRRIAIFDTTLRDGEQSPGIALRPHEKAEIAAQLERLGVDVIEAGFAASSPGDFEGVRAVAEAVERPTVASLCRASKDDVDAAAEALPALVLPLDPLVAQWDRLSEECACHMLILRDGVKVDFMLDRPPQLEPPWEVRPDTLAALDGHFWDWILWLGGKQLRGRQELVRSMLGGLMFEHLLGPLGVSRPPESIAKAVAVYRQARAKREHELGVEVPRQLEEAVLARLRAAGLA